MPIGPLLFVVGAVLLWLSVYGYLIVLHLLVRRRRRATVAAGDLPAVAVLVPTLDEGPLLAGKIDDLAQTEYPEGRLRVIVVDGGSADGSVDAIRGRRVAGRTVEVLWPEAPAGPRPLSSAWQIREALREVDEEVVVCTDVDSRLAPDCIRRLVGSLVTQEGDGLVAARVMTASPLPEERLHWRLLNHLWWLEGEVLAASGASGVCFAVRRALAADVAARGRAPDLDLAQTVASRGYRARLCPEAVATEVRVPRSRGDLLAYRRRRGRGYLDEVRRRRGPGPIRYRLARRFRLWQLRVAPGLALGLAAATPLLLVSPYWRVAVAATVLFALPPLTLLVGGARAGRVAEPWTLSLAFGRLVVLNLLALVTLVPAAELRLSGEEPNA